MDVFKLQSTAKVIFKDIDLYSTQTLLIHLSKYPFVSFRRKSIPQQGSPTWFNNKLKSKLPNVEHVTKIICHKDGKTTILTEKGYLQYFAAGQQIKD